METNEELGHLRAIASKQTEQILSLREMFLAVVSDVDYQCWCDQKVHTPECQTANKMIRIFERGKNVNRPN